MSDGSRTSKGTGEISLPESMRTVLLQLGTAWAGASSPWLVGGSCGLLLQGVALASTPRDVDVYTDEPYVADLHLRLADYASDEPEWSETGIYRSYLSHYRMQNVCVELVASLEVDAAGSQYTVEVADILAKDGPTITIDGRSIPLMPLSHELLFNLLRNRPDRYEPIAAAMRANWPEHAVLLRHMELRARLSPDIESLLARLVPASGREIDTSAHSARGEGIG